MTQALMQPLIVPLTEEQQDAVELFMEAARQAEAAGAPGMVLGQIFGDHMHVGFMPHDKAKAMSASGRVSRTAYDVENDP